MSEYAQDSERVITIRPEKFEKVPLNRYPLAVLLGRAGQSRR